MRTQQTLGKVKLLKRKIISKVKRNSKMPLRQSIKFRATFALIVVVSLAIGLIGLFGLGTLYSESKHTLNESFSEIGIKQTEDFETISTNLVKSVLEVETEIRERLEDVAVSSTRKTMEEVAKVIRSHFKSTELVVGLVNQSPNTYKANVVEEDQKSLIASFVNLRNQFEALEHVFVGYEDGTMISEPWIDINDYDPRINPWYKKAIDNPGEIVWTEPYLDFGTGVLIITAAKTIANSDGDIVGVTGANINMNEIREYIYNIEVGNGGYVVSLDNNGIVLNHPKDKDKTNTDDYQLIGKTLENIIPELHDFGIDNLRKNEIIRYQWESDPTNKPGEYIEKISIAVKVPDVNITLLGAFEQSKIDSVGNTSVNKLNDSIAVTSRSLDKASKSTSDKLVKTEEEALETIRSGTFKSVVIGVIILIVLGVIIFISISRFIRPIVKLSESANRLADGDFTIPIDEYSLGEIGVAVKSLHSIKEKIGSILTDVKNASGEISDSSQLLSTSGLQLKESSQSISMAVDEIARGAREQANDTEEGSALIDGLATSIVELNNNLKELVLKTVEVNKANDEGLIAINSMNEKTQQTEKVYNNVTSDVEDLSHQISKVGAITQTIDDIANQTNLLALNASIESARAGVHGRGFAVVAEEIRKLAELTAVSTMKITEMITDVTRTTEKVMGSIKSVSDLTRQNVDETTNVNGRFNEIAELVETMAKMIEKSSYSVNEINVSKDNVIAKMMNIVAVTEETSASTQEVSSSMAEQEYSVESIAEMGVCLNELVSKLNIEINKFKV